jgi:hypothetical protein
VDPLNYGFSGLDIECEKAKYYLQAWERFVFEIKKHY